MLALAGIMPESMKEQAIVWRWPARRVWSKVQATKAGCFRSTAGSTQRYPRFHRLSTGDNDGLAREDIDLGRRCEERAVRFKGSLFQAWGWDWWTGHE